MKPAPRFRLIALFAVLWMLAGVRLSLSEAAQATPAIKGRIFILMVWDGLRPDFVTEANTPNLLAMAREGVLLANHHAVYPTVTMVNAATLATGLPPAGSGIAGDAVDFDRALPRNVGDEAERAKLVAKSRDLIEDSHLLAALNGPRFMNGGLLGAESLGQQVARIGGYVAIIGKRGPTFFFDDAVASDSPEVADAENRGRILFVSDDMIEPSGAAASFGPQPPMSATEAVPAAARDAYFARIVADKALPAAKAAGAAGHPALIVFWQHNPDITQHIAGLGTAAAIGALKACDANLARVRGTIRALGISDRTDLMIVSDHGFATIKESIDVASLLAAHGLKESAESDDVRVVPNGGSELIYLSRATFPFRSAIRERLARIADFVEAQPWAGAVFSAAASASESDNAGGANASGRASTGGRGWIAGTFSEEMAGLSGSANPERAPDLVISFRELPDDNNLGLTGPLEPAWIINRLGREQVDNRSHALVTPTDGLIYSDLNTRRFTTGMGMHGAMGARELHNFGAIAGPDFRARFIDTMPTGNLDVRATIARALGIEAPSAVGIAHEIAPGRVIDEAFADGVSPAGSVKQIVSAVTRAMPQAGMSATTRLHLSEFHSVANPRATEIYFDGAETRRIPAPR